jgi:hypothetical protein
VNDSFGTALSVRKNTPRLPSGPRSATLRRATSSIALDASIAINRDPSFIRRRISIVGQPVPHDTSSTWPRSGTERFLSSILPKRVPQTGAISSS